MKLACSWSGYGAKSQDEAIIDSHASLALASGESKGD
jgi:hypothetical protein